MTTVYRYFGANDELLYVGVTDSIERREAGHRTKPWWPEVARREVAEFKDRQDALYAEGAAIRSENPLHNVQPGMVCMSPEIKTRLEAAARFNAERDSAIRQARIEGETLRSIADIVGLSWSGVRRIITTKETPE